MKGGYHPPVVHGRAGEPLHLVFRREETSPCSEHVVFPELGKSAMLPPFEDVAIDLVPERPGRYEFTCQLGVLRGALVVDGDPTLGRTSRRVAKHARAHERASDEYGETVLLSLVTWLCSLPLLLLLSVPFLGWRAGGLLGLLWLGVVVTACFGICVRRTRRREPREALDPKPVSRPPLPTPPGTAA